MGSRAQDGTQADECFGQVFMAGAYVYTYTIAMTPISPAQILHRIGQIQHMEPGKLCVMRQGPNGPYYNLQWREEGKAISRYVPSDQVEAVAHHTANYERFQALVAQYAQVIIEQTRAERTAGFKKKTSPLRSS
jgi:hypothetical protein